MNGNFFILENSIFNYDLDVYEFKIYAYLCMRADIKTKNCFPSACKIARRYYGRPRVLGLCVHIRGRTSA